MNFPFLLSGSGLNAVCTLNREALASNQCFEPGDLGYLSVFWSVHTGFISQGVRGFFPSPTRWRICVKKKISFISWLVPAGPAQASAGGITAAALLGVDLFLVKLPVAFKRASSSFLLVNKVRPHSDIPLALGICGLSALCLRTALKCSWMRLWDSLGLGYGIVCTVTPSRLLLFQQVKGS